MNIETATPVETTQEQIDRLAQALTSRMGVRKELKTLAEVLQPGEDLIAMAAGEYEGKQGLVVASNTRLFFYERGMMGGKQEDFLYPKISSVQNDSGMMSGKLKIVTSGASAEIKIFDKKRAQELGNLVRSKLQESYAAPLPSAAPSPPVESASVEERLARLDGLRDAGVITQAEFDERRTAIIAEL